MDYTLPETSLIQIKTLEKVDNMGTFVIEPLSPGYGVTIGNSLRRVLLSSLEGAAITSVKIEGANHQFMSLPAIKENVVDIILNLKTLRFRGNLEEPITLKLKAKGPKTVRAQDFDSNPNCQVVNTEALLATIGKSGKLNMEIMVARGRGYVPIERRKDEKLPIGTMAVDSIFTPVKKVHYELENTRVGGMTNFDKLTMEITTDGSIDPEIALARAAKILVEHFNLVDQACQTPPKKEKPAKKALKENGVTKKATKKIK